MSASDDRIRELFAEQRERLERMKPKPKTAEEERAEIRFWGMVAVACMMLGAAFIAGCLALVVLLWRLALGW